MTQVNYKISILSIRLNLNYDHCLDSSETNHLKLRCLVEKRHMPAVYRFFFLCGYLNIIRKTLKGRKQTNKYGRGTERHLPKTDESIVRPAGEHR